MTPQNSSYSLLYLNLPNLLLVSRIVEKNLLKNITITFLPHKQGHLRLGHTANTDFTID